MKKESNPKLIRVNVVYGVIFCSMSALILRLGYLQIVHGAEFRTQANTTMLAQLPVLPSRGRIYDTNHTLLAYDKPSFSVVLTRLNTPTQDLDDLAKRLAPIFGMKREDLLREMGTKDRGETQVRILSNATNEQVSFVAENLRYLPGIHVVQDPQREYPFGVLAGHVLGYVHSQPPSEVNKYRALHYLPDQWVGIDGVERQYESILQGKAGERVVEVNSHGVPIKEFGLDPAPMAGNNLELTLDAHLQAQAQQIVVDELSKIKQTFGYDPTDAEAVMLDVKSGGVLALVSYPYYDPNWYMTDKSYLKHVGYLNNPRLTPMLNHVLQSPRYPGSTVKPVNVLAGLESGVISPFTVMPDPGVAEIGTYKLHDWLAGGHGNVDAVMAIETSCDTFMSYMALWMAGWYGGPPAGVTAERFLTTYRIKGLNKLFQWEWMMGLGQLTGIDLPYEAAGHFEDEGRRYDWVKAATALRTKGSYDDKGLLYDLAAAAIGQDQQFTPMELAQYVMTIANNGVKLRPHVLKRVFSPDGRILKSIAPLVQTRLHVTQSHLKVVQDGMFAVVNKPDGTAYPSFHDAPYHAAGKTGTAQVMIGNRKDHISMFIAYAPVENPEVCMAIMVPGGGESGDTAVPMGRALLDAYFKEHHQFFPRDKWMETRVPANWEKMSAYTIPENAGGPR